MMKARSIASTLVLWLANPALAQQPPAPASMPAKVHGVDPIVLRIEVGGGGTALAKAEGKVPAAFRSLPAGRVLQWTLGDQRAGDVAALQHLLRQCFGDRKSWRVDPLTGLPAPAPIRIVAADDVTWQDVAGTIDAVKYAKFEVVDLGFEHSDRLEQVCPAAIEGTEGELTLPQAAFMLPDDKPDPKRIELRVLADGRLRHGDRTLAAAGKEVDDPQLRAAAATFAAGLRKNRGIGAGPEAGGPPPAPPCLLLVVDQQIRWRHVATLLAVLQRELTLADGRSPLLQLAVAEPAPPPQRRR